MRHYIATIRFDADEDVNVKHAVDVACDRLQDAGGNIHVYDSHIEEETLDETTVQSSPA